MTNKFDLIYRTKAALMDLQDLYEQEMTDAGIRRIEKFICSAEKEIEENLIAKEELDMKLDKLQVLSARKNSLLSELTRTAKEAEEAAAALADKVRGIVRRYDIENLAERMMNKKRMKDDRSVQAEYESIRDLIKSKYEKVLDVEGINLKAVKQFIEQDYRSTDTFTLFKISLRFYVDVDLT